MNERAVGPDRTHGDDGSKEAREMDFVVTLIIAVLRALGFFRPTARGR